MAYLQTLEMFRVPMDIAPHVGFLQISTKYQDLPCVCRDKEDIIMNHLMIPETLINNRLFMCC